MSVCVCLSGSHGKRAGGCMRASEPASREGREGEMLRRKSFTAAAASVMFAVCFDFARKERQSRERLDVGVI